MLNLFQYSRGLKSFRFFLLSAVTAVLSSHGQEVYSNHWTPNQESGFWKNNGQCHDQLGRERNDIIAYGSGNGFDFHLSKDGISYQTLLRDSLNLQDGRIGEESDSLHFYRLDARWVNPSTKSEIVFVDLQKEYNTFCHPRLSDGMVVSHKYGEVQLKGLYEGIDLKYYFNDGLLEYDFILEPGKSPSSNNGVLKELKKLECPKKGI